MLELIAWGHLLIWANVLTRYLFLKSTVKDSTISLIQEATYLRVRLE